ncbi:MAG TPA: hypothetical protein VK192_05910 [Sphingomicrobium sp.]|jgi:hypothetical protein|nr:hypothetical protein [Sphingomicrobium sp.]
MKPVLLFAGVVALGFSGPGLAKPGMGHGNGHMFAYGVDHSHGHANAIGQGALHGHGLNGPVGYGIGGCPPGLAKKAIPCMPPGQSKKLGIGSQVPMGYDLLPYSSLPRTVRTRHSLSMRSRYVYNGDILYEVSPRTRTVTQVIRTR